MCSSCHNWHYLCSIIKHTERCYSVAFNVAFNLHVLLGYIFPKVLSWDFSLHTVRDYKWDNATISSIRCVCRKLVPFVELSEALMKRALKLVCFNKLVLINTAAKVCSKSCPTIPVRTASLTPLRKGER